MSADLGTLRAQITADYAGLRNAALQSRALFGSIVGSAGPAALAVGAVGTAALAAGAGVAAGGAVAAQGLRDFRRFDAAMTRSAAIIEGLSASMREEMEQTALTMATEGLHSAEQLAESYFFLASAGLSAEEQIQALGPVTQFATAGAFDLATATDLLTDAQSALGKTTDEMVNVSDVLVAANTLANASVEQFSESLTNEAGPALRAYNVDLEEGVAVLAAYADQGPKGQRAGSMFGRSLRLLVQAAQENEAAFRDMNIEVFNAEGELNNMADIVGQMETAFDGMSTEQRTVTLDMLGFQARTQQAILPLLGVSKEIRRYEAGLRSAGGTTQRIAERQMQSLDSMMVNLGNSIEVVSTRIGQELAPEFRGVVGELDEMADALAENEEFFRSISVLADTTAVAFNNTADSIDSVTTAIEQGSGALGFLAQITGAGTALDLAGGFVDWATSDFQSAVGARQGGDIFGDIFDDIAEAADEVASGGEGAAGGTADGVADGATAAASIPTPGVSFAQALERGTAAALQAERRGRAAEPEKETAQNTEQMAGDLRDMKNLWQRAFPGNDNAVTELGA